MADKTEAWASIVLAEASVAYAYAVAGPRLPDAEQGAAKTLYDSHEQARDQALLALIAAGGAAPDIATFFDLPDAVTTPEQARAVLALVESRLATSYADLIGALQAPDRQYGLDQVLLATNRSLQWGAVPGPWGATVPAAAQGS